MRQALGGYDDDVGGRSDEFALVGEQREDDGYDAPSDRRLPSIVVSMLVMALFAGGLWFAYHLGSRHAATARVAPDGTSSASSVPLIRADQTPDKIRPEQPGGMKIPDQNDSIYNEKPGVAAVEKLLPPPETPLPGPEPPPPSSPQVAVVSPPAATPAPAVPRVQEARPEPRPAAAEARPPAIAAPRFANGGAIHVRLASVRTPEEARSEWERLKHANADLLGRLSAFAVRTDLGDRGIYYRIEAGPFGDAAAAERLCGELKRRNLGCILAR